MAKRSGYGWRSSLTPQEYFCTLGRRVRCTVCRTWQRTDPAAHTANLRLREMTCTTEGCLGRLRTLGWWARLEAAQAEYLEHTRAPENAGLKGLGVDVPRGLDCRESDRPKQSSYVGGGK